MAATVHTLAPTRTALDGCAAADAGAVQNVVTEILADQSPPLTSKDEHPPMTTPPLVFIGAAAVERAASIEVLASAAYLHWCLHRAEESTWAHCTGVTRERYLEHAEMLADALATAGRLPILCEERATWIAGDGHRAYDERPRSYWQKRLAWPDTQVQSRYVTEWQQR